jgi:hypothetical protein
MPCYIHPVKETTELINGRITRIGGFTLFTCGQSLDEPHCFACMDFGDYLCDYPVGKGKTCDRAMCESHRHNVAPELDYCDSHYPEWCKFRDGGGPQKHFENVIPFRGEKG